VGVLHTASDENPVISACKSCPSAIVARITM
jgi:hypothetical protein